VDCQRYATIGFGVWERLLCLPGLTSSWGFSVVAHALFAGRTTYFAAAARDSLQMISVYRVDAMVAPDFSATSQLVGDLASHMAAAGHEVHVVTSRQLYDQPQARLPAEETHNGVRVHRINTTRFSRANLLGRALDYL
jgi:hypothetical protein